MSAEVSGRSTRTPGHRWLPYEGDDGFLDEGMGYLRAGVADAARLVYASGRPLEQMEEDVQRLDPDAALRGSGVLTLLPVDVRAEVRADDYVAYFAGETERALRDGRSGLRVLAELSSLAQGPQRAALLRYEHLADRYMAAHPMSALCAVDRGQVPEPAVAELEALHPQVAADSRSVGFHLLPEDDGLRLTGAVDAWDAEHLAEVLQAITGDPTSLSIHVEGLEFIGARGLAVLSRHRRRLAERGADIVVVGAHPVLRRACSALGLDLGLDLGRAR